MKYIKFAQFNGHFFQTKIIPPFLRAGQNLVLINTMDWFTQLTSLISSTRC